MKQKLVKFILFVYERYIYEDFSEYKHPLRFFIYSAWYIRSTLIWIFSPFIIPQYLLLNSPKYKALIAGQQTMTPEQVAAMNKMVTRNFLSRKSMGKKMVPRGKKK